MLAHCYFQNIQHIDHLDDFLRLKIQSVVDQFIPDERYTLSTRVRKTKGRADHKKPEFLCEIRLEAPRYSSSIVVKRKSNDFYQAATKVGAVLMRVLRKESAEHAHHHRREFKREMEKSGKFELILIDTEGRGTESETKSKPKNNEVTTAQEGEPYANENSSISKG